MQGKHLAIDYREVCSALGLETPIAYIVRSLPRRDKIVLVPVTHKWVTIFRCILIKMAILYNHTNIYSL